MINPIVRKVENGYMPISLQYNDYTATYARNPSLAGGDPFENFTNRSYKGKSVKTANKQDMLSVLETKAKMKGKPVIVSLEMDKPTICPSSRVRRMPSGELRCTKPSGLGYHQWKSRAFRFVAFADAADMRIVEEQFEDVPRDMKCYTDSEGHLYDFAFCMNWKGVIDYERVTKYK
ncbi:beta-glucosidase [Parabacteroides distasonis]|uniref:beta-glucosidase n=1 Tax=Parabacteroides distasonis TaxID=823 RepID=UPI001D12EE04|nr:beta-glucosidase [Parabacteroides distasonis]